MSTDATVPIDIVNQTHGNLIKSSRDDDCDRNQLGSRENILDFGGQFDTETVDKSYQAYKRTQKEKKKKRLSFSKYARCESNSGLKIYMPLYIMQNALAQTFTYV